MIWYVFIKIAVLRIRIVRDLIVPRFAHTIKHCSWMFHSKELKCIVHMYNSVICVNLGRLFGVTWFLGRQIVILWMLLQESQMHILTQKSLHKLAYASSSGGEESAALYR